MKFSIKNRWTGNIQFTADIECDENDEALDDMKNRAEAEAKR